MRNGGEDVRPLQDRGCASIKPIPWVETHGYSNCSLSGSQSMIAHQLPFHLLSYQIRATLPTTEPSPSKKCENSRYVVRSENSISVHVRNLKALKHDSILVLRPIHGAKELRTWPEPARITTKDSCAFCRECAAGLGWFLRSDLGEKGIHLAWSNLLEEKGNGKAPR